ncbi:MAG TPA: carbonic anhydrase [Phycisphaerales bacterium]|nr:carbonic anhydrase [Phycisphaerales bacterium]
MTTRTLILAAGLAFSLPFALAAADDHPKPAPKPAATHSDDAHGAKPTTQPAAKPAAQPASKPKTSIWDAAKSKSKTADKPTEKPTEKSTDKKSDAHDDDHTSDQTDDHPDGHAAPAAKPTAKNPSKAQPAPAPVPAHAAAADSISPDEALALLQEGNQRWADGEPTNPNTDADRREDLAAHGQKPFVTVLTCADSRIPVERVFDRGVGEVFTVRVAGNVAGESEAGTIEYGVGHLKTGLLVVMGHTKCGAVAAACSGAQVHGKVASLIQHVTPAVERARKNNPGASESELATLTERENVWQSVYDLLKSSDEVREMVAAKNLKVVGAIYDISTGKVEFMGEHPWQTELVAAIDSASQHAGTTMTVAVEADEPETDNH